MAVKHTNEQLDTLKVRTVNKQFGEETQREITLELLDELKAAREDIERWKTNYDIMYGNVLDRERQIAQLKNEANQNNQHKTI